MILAAITTCKRNPEMLERAIKSVIAQTYTDWNLVVVDDSPADYELRGDVRKMVEAYAEHDSRISYIPHDTNRGVSAARNTALKFAENTYRGGGNMNTLRTSTTMMNGCPKNYSVKSQSSTSAEKISDWFTAVIICATMCNTLHTRSGRSLLAITLEMSLCVETLSGLRAACLSAQSVLVKKEVLTLSLLQVLKIGICG